MPDFTKKICPICNQPIQQYDDVAVCPDCGLPHHRACFLGTGHCADESNHGKPEGAGGPYNKSDFKECPRCGSHNDPELTQCAVCFCALEKECAKPENGTKTNGGADSSPLPPFFPFGPSIMNSKRDPLGGVPKDEKISDEPVVDVASAVGPGSEYYLPKFNAIDKKKGVAGFNPAAFFLTFIWLFFRKCVAEGIFAMSVHIALSVTQLFFTQTALDALGGNADAADIMNQYAAGNAAVTTPVNMLSLCVLLHIINMLVWGCFANRIYFHSTIKHIKRIRKKAKDNSLTPEDSAAEIIRGGRVSLFYPFIAITMAYMMVNSLFDYLY